MTSPVPALEPAPLSPWGRLWRILVCLLASLVMLTITITELDAAGLADQDRFALPITLDVLALTPVLYIALWWHRRFPLWLCVLVALASGVSTMAMGPSTLLLVSIATRRRWTQILPMAAAIVVATACYERVYPTQEPLVWWVALPLYTAITAALVAWGMYIGARRELVAQWRWRAENAEAEQSRQVAAAAQGERTRIAREMHDVLAHRLSQVSLHAGVMSYRTDLAPEQVRAEAETIRAASTAALADLRSILGVLRNTEDGAVSAPQPTLADLPALVAESDGPVRLVDRTEGSVPDPLGRHAYRVVQEGLTNAHRHAPGAAVVVELSGRAGHELEVRVTNGPGAPSEGGGAGLGLVGVRERATILGGSVTAAPSPAGGWALVARLPWPRRDDDVPTQNEETP